MNFLFCDVVGLTDTSFDSVIQLFTKEHEMNGYDFVALDEARNNFLRDKMCALYKKLLAAGITRPVKIIEFRDSYKKGNAIIPLEDDTRKILNEVISLESEILGSVTATGKKLSQAFFDISSCPGLTFDDFMQEAAIAVYDAIYTYNGAVSFHTFAYKCIKSRLSSFLASEKTKARYSQHELSDYLVKNKLNQNDGDKENIRRMLLQAIEITTDLTDLERKLVMAILDGDKGIAEDLPEVTGRNRKTKIKNIKRDQAFMSYHRRSACRKLRCSLSKFAA